MEYGRSREWLCKRLTPVLLLLIRAPLGEDVLLALISDLKTGCRILPPNLSLAMEAVNNRVERLVLILEQDQKT
jgi:hypothetical protein